jgi:hypothetical protein
MMPGTFLYVSLGYWGRWTWQGTTTTHRSSGEWFLLGLGLLATVGLTIYLSRLARSILRQRLSSQQTLSQQTPPHQTLSQQTPPLQTLSQ